MYKVNLYPDGASYVETDTDVEETFRVNSYEDLWHLAQLVDAKNNLGVTPTIIIPNLLDAQADRRFAENQSHGLKLVLSFLNSMDADFEIFHPHNQEVVEAALDNVKIISNTLFMRKVLTGRSQEDIVLMSSDAGGFKPLMKLCDELNWQGETFSASKARMSNGEMVQQIDRDDFNGKDVMIVDDICVRGGTFIGLAKMLWERNVSNVYLAVSHMTLENLSPELFEVFTKVYTTNSKFNNYYIPHREGGIQPFNLTIYYEFGAE